MTDALTMQLIPTEVVHPDSSSTMEGDTRKLSNYMWSGRTRVPIRVPLIIDKLNELTGGYPIKICGTLFARDESSQLVQLEKPDTFFAWLQQQFAVDWSKCEGAITKAEFFEAVKMQAPSFSGMHNYPHYPEIAGVFYNHREIPEGDGTALEAFVNFFCPATLKDRQLIIAMILTIFWGGPSGQRPAFLIQSSDSGKQQGRGVGKSTLAMAVSKLAGGFTSISPSESIEKIKTRLLSPADSLDVNRILLIDNIKTRRFSWADLESLITSDKISGHAMYQGGAALRNDYTVMMTMNGADVSKDLAQRTVVIQVKRPQHHASWYDNLLTHIQEHQWQIIGDIIAILKSEGSVLPANNTTRWGSWEAGVLSKLPSPDQLRQEIIKRQSAIDDDASEAEAFLEFLQSNLSTLCIIPVENAAPGSLPVKLTQSNMRDFWQEFSNTKIAMNSVKKKIDSLGLGCLKQVGKKGRAKTWLFRPDGKNLTRSQLSTATN